MQPKCKKCGKPLHNPVSIARGMGPDCAGIVRNGRSYPSIHSLQHGTPCPVVGDNRVSANLFSFADNNQSRFPKVLEGYPSDLVKLVLSVPEPGSIAIWVKKYSSRKLNKVQPVILLKQIRRACIEHRLLFWPGISMNQEPIACIPQGQDGWKIGENGRVVNKDQLIAYLSRYGIVAQDQLQGIA